MLAGKVTPFNFKIEIPVDQDLLPEARTPESLAAEKRSALSTPRVPKSPEQLRKAEERSVLLRKFHVEAVQARAARENQRAEDTRARRLRTEANARQRLQNRFTAVAERDALMGEQKKKAVEAKADFRAQRAEEARQARQAMEQARNEKLASASERVEESSRRASNIVKATADKNAFLAKRALAVVTAHKELQLELTKAAADKIASKIAAATMRRNDALELLLPRAAMSRMDMAKAELAKIEGDRQHKKLELERSIAAATERRESKLESRVFKARADISRVQAAHDTRAMMVVEAEADLVDTRRALFAKLNAADVRAKELLSRRASKNDAPPVVFEIPLWRETGAKTIRLPAQLIQRLKTKSRVRCMKPAIDLATRKALSGSARVTFALKNAARSKANARDRVERAAAHKAAIFERTRSGAARAKRHTQSRVAVARCMNDRVFAASVRRSSTLAAKQKALAKRALRVTAASGRRAMLLLARSANAEGVARAAMFRAHRNTIATARETRGIAQRLRGLVAALKQSENLASKAAKAHMFTLPYSQLRAKLAKASRVVPNKKQASITTSKPTPLDNFGMIGGRSPPMGRSTSVVEPLVPVASNMGGFVDRSPQGKRASNALSSTSSDFSEVRSVVQSVLERIVLDTQAEDDWVKVSR